MMRVLIIPIAVSMHTVVSWIFAMTLREPWDNPMFGAYFVVGAIFSGVAVLILLMTLFRRIYRRCSRTDRIVSRKRAAAPSVTPGRFNMEDNRDCT